MGNGEESVGTDGSPEGGGGERESEKDGKEGGKGREVRRHHSRGNDFRVDFVRLVLRPVSHIVSTNASFNSTYALGGGGGGGGRIRGRAKKNEFISPTRCCLSHQVEERDVLRVSSVDKCGV